MKQEGKILYTISEVADMLNVNQSLIRYWETEFPSIIKPKRNKRGVRYFSNKDIENLKEIYYLVKEKNYTLKGAKTAFKKENYNKDESNIYTNSLNDNNPNNISTNTSNIIQFPNDDSLKYNHKEIYERLLNIRKLAEKLLDE